MRLRAIDTACDSSHRKRIVVSEYAIDFETLVCLKELST
jgi:hypothetical protein